MAWRHNAAWAAPSMHTNQKGQRKRSLASHWWPGYGDEDAADMSKTASTAESIVREAALEGSLGRCADVCPHCNASCGAPNLLTSMMRYYTCGSCAARWHVPRQWQVDTMV